MTFFSSQPTRKGKAWTPAELRMLGRALNSSEMPWQDKGDTETDHESGYELLDEFIDKICSHNIFLPKRQTEARENGIKWRRPIFNGLLSAAIFIFWFHPRTST
jgi:hypothetical protein